jgi:aminomethyltransferase
MRTPLFQEHERFHAKIVDFHGWDMPVWYTGIKEEHMATRSSAGLFDASHMGEIFVTGMASVPFLERVQTRAIGKMPKNKVYYSFFLNEKGCIIDDLTVYCVTPGERYMLCVNASNTENDLAWLRVQNEEGAAIEDRSSSTALIALQGPEASRIFKVVTGFDLDGLKNYTFVFVGSEAYGDLMVSKTGYTGAGGAEIFLDASRAPKLWEDLAAQGAMPCGLGARDTLRLEMGFPLHGNDIDETTTPLEACQDFAVDLGKPCFIGRDALLKQAGEGLPRRLMGLELEERGIPRQGCVCLKNGTRVGIVTSGTISPVLGIGIALAYLDRGVTKGDEVDVMVRDKPLKARVVHPPFTGGAMCIIPKRT